ncbi:hypothetical protein [Flavobacterium sp.]|uniref:hypothetical protein n=1 Tax=Flavobacterium sp. TaxID=239 RepID=UPI0037528348
MKTISLFFISTFLLFGFKYSENNIINNENIVLQKCISIEEYKKIDTSESDKQAQWLKINSDNVCEKEEFYKLVYGQHLINKVKFENELKNSANDKILKIHWLDLNKMLSKYGDYEKYVAFQVDSNGKLGLKLIDNFVKSPSCYSVAFFRSIFYDKTINILDPKVFFEFHQLDNGYVIFSLIEVNGPQENRLSFHNISDVPLLVSPHLEKENNSYSFQITKYDELKIKNLNKQNFDMMKNKKSVKMNKLKTKVK